MRKLLAVTLGKSISHLTKNLKIGGGSAAPGHYALKIDPNLVKKLVQKIPKTIIITGTNGKTTTARILSQLLESQGLKVLRNHTGSNLERGIASALISHYSLFTIHNSVEIAIWELDEAAFNKLAPILNPDLIIFLNVLRDQLDRYGEVNSVVKNWLQVLPKLPKKTKLLINGDDANLLQIKKNYQGETLTFGLQSHKISGESAVSKKTKLDFEAQSIKSLGLQGSSFIIQNSLFRIPIPGFYHIYDALAALSAASLVLPDTPILRYSDTLKSYFPAFGRFEKFVLPLDEWEAKNEGYIFLIKNPRGATEVFETITPELKSGDQLLIALNDNFADGTDVSWIWDTNFELLTRRYSDTLILCAGTRAQDLAVRLKYAGFDPKLIVVQPDLKQAFKQATTGLEGRLFILPTYTALLELQKILVTLGIKSHYWNEP